MSFFPQVNMLPDGLVQIGTFSMASVGSMALQASGNASATYPTANLAIYIPFRIARPYMVTQLFTHNGAAVSGNIDVGLYSSDGTRLVSSGSTAQAGTNAIQTFNTTDVTIGPGLFYMAVSMDNTTGTLFRQTFTLAPALKVIGMAEQTSAFALPASATFATSTSNYLPMIGLTMRSFV